MLHMIQAELKAPKGQFNSFGKYRYRSCEDIVEAAKPILAKYECSLVICDDIVPFGDRLFVKATARILSAGAVIAEAFAFAEHALEKKGMDAAQVTGATSSYARKYALNGLLAIDDTKDADATNTHGKEEVVDLISKEQVGEIQSLLKTTKSDTVKFMKVFDIQGVENMTAAQFERAETMLKTKLAQMLERGEV